MKAKILLKGAVFLTVVLLVFSLALSGCEGDLLGDIGNGNGNGEVDDLEEAKLFAENLSNHSVNMMELVDRQAIHLEDAFMNQVAPYAEATFYRMVWLAEILEIWADHIEDPGDYDIDFADWRGIGIMSVPNADIMEVETLVWNFTIDRFYDDLDLEEDIIHEVKIESYPLNHYVYTVYDDEEDIDITVINLADADFKYTHERYIDGDKDNNFDWSLEVKMDTDEYEKILLFEDDWEKVYVKLPLEPDFKLTGLMEDDLRIADVYGYYDNNGGFLDDDYPALGKLDIDITLKADNDAKIITSTGEINAESAERETVNYTGSANLEYGEFDFSDNFKLELIEFDSSSNFIVENYFEITGGLLIEFEMVEFTEIPDDEIVFADIENRTWELPIPQKVELNGSYEDLTEVTMKLTNLVIIELLNLADFDFDSYESEDNFIKVKVSLDASMETTFEPVDIEIIIERTGYEEVTVDPMNYYFADGRFMKGEGEFGPEGMSMTAENDSGHFMHMNVIFEPDNGDEDHFKVGELRDASQATLADIIMDNQGMYFEFVDGTVIGVPPRENNL